MDHVGSLDELAGLTESRGPLYVRFSAGPDADAAGTSVDHESGCELPGLSVNPLTPEPWFDRPTAHWVARQLMQYAHLDDDRRFPWVLTGRVVGRGPDCEPLLDDVQPVAQVPPSVVDEARELYEREFSVGNEGA